ncbi:high-affinity nickel-transport protein-domain-containing protein [Aspergillus alliaceus]|uniref:high-affinity nickel-transport protein-domain-containing protein n=1 Tax=Petromyces alliaceus TaxID=209559 RepID=UPI0012A5DE62|nr:high-affinity nickel-transport protein-domain-containing protein [Aspergillus alliaceus]KAB8231807.1 high-affinity nickel-transport protein-domain-containing protein [Aspergillus alliaceus]
MRDSSPPSFSGETSDPQSVDTKSKWAPKSLMRHAERSHSRIPGVRKIPFRALAIILFIALINIIVWIAAAIVLVRYPPISLVSNAVLAYTLGLRHAFDADHISAIDLMTRRLLATGQKPVTVGTFFSLGHSTIVIITSIVVAATAAAVSSRFDSFSTVGGIIGTSVSAAFLILLGLMNFYILYKLYKQMQKVLDLPEGQEDEAWKIEGGGILFSVLKKMFKLIDRPWKMYPLGILFGLGFDTSSEIALLGISSVEAARGTDFWVILIFPILFTAGMCLLDTTDGALMLSLYIQPAANFLPPKDDSSAAETPLIGEDHEIQPSQNHRDPIAFLYYSIVLTCLTVVVAIVIGVIQLLTLVLNVAEPTGKFWDGVQTAGDYYDAIGGGICGCFIIIGGISVLVYKPWRRWVARRHGKTLVTDEEGYRDNAAASQEAPILSEEQGGAPGASYGAISKKGASQVAVKPVDGPSRFSSYAPIFVLPTHLSLEALHHIEESLVSRDARLTYDASEARLILGKVGQKKRAALELRSRGVWTEDLDLATTEVSDKRSRVHESNTRSKDAVAEVEVVDLSTESESEEDGVQSKHDTGRHLKRPRPRSISSDRSLVAFTQANTSISDEQTDILRVVRLEWLDKCIETKELVPIEPFMVYQARKVERPATQPSSTYTKGSQASDILQRARQDAVFKPPPALPNRFARRHEAPSSQHHPPKLYRQSTSENEETAPLPPSPDWVKNNTLYACMRSAPLHPPNERFINQLIKIRQTRELTLDEIGVRAYSTSIASIAAYPYEFRRPSEVLTLPGCDTKIANLFAEYQQSEDGTLEAATALDTDPVLHTLHQFYSIWGVGAKTARDFYYHRQWRDLDDIVEHGWNTLSRVQQIGVKYYDEFLAGISRPEVESIARIIHRHANLVRPDARYDGRGVECIVVGGYRRGKEASGDVDLILSHRDESVTRNLVVDVVASLESEGWITHTLALHLTTSNRDQQTLPYRGDDTGKHFDSLDKALVVWQDPHFEDGTLLPEADDEEQVRLKRKRNTNPHRRVDIIISPWRTVGCAVLGWSGDTTFERDLRRYAKKRGWKFDSSGVRERTSGGQVIDLEREGRTWEERERLVMEGLGVGWRPPGERCTR